MAGEQLTLRVPGEDLVSLGADKMPLRIENLDVKPGATVIDVGVNRVPDAARKAGYRLVGDVDFERVREKAGLITPVPGGVGPMTIAVLLRNALVAAHRNAGVALADGAL